MADEVERLTEYAHFALSNGNIKTYEDMLRLFAWIVEQTQEKGKRARDGCMAVR
jgi:hypothetical protein